MKNELSLNNVEKKAFIFVFCVSLLSLLSLIQANVLYNDDILRVLSGDRFWNSDGRPLSSIASIILQMGTPLTDISPIPQIISVALYSISSIYFGKVFKVNGLIFLILGGIVFVINPFNLQNFSYIFDSFTMGIAVFLATVAFVFTDIFITKRIGTNIKIAIFFIVVLLLFLALCFYQAATSIYISAFTFYALLKLKDGIQESIKGLVFSAAMLFCALIAYIPVKNYYIGADGYILVGSQLPPFPEQPKVFMQNLLFSISYLRESLGNSHLSFLLLLLGTITTISFLVIILKKNITNKHKVKFLKLFFLIILSLIYCFIIICSFYGISLIFANPPWKPRLFMGFSATVGFATLFLTRIFYFSNIIKNFLIFFFCLLSLSFANVSWTFGNTLHYQNTQEEIIASVLLSDLEAEISQLSNYFDRPKIAIAGQLKPSPLTDRAFAKYPILRLITTVHFTQGWWHGNQRLKSLEFKFNSEFVELNNIIPKNKSLLADFQPIITRRIYNIYFENNDTFIILFKD